MDETKGTNHEVKQDARHHKEGEIDHWVVAEPVSQQHVQQTKDQTVDCEPDHKPGLGKKNGWTELGQT